MSDERGTLETIAEHLALAAEPLRYAVADQAAFQAFILRLGWDAQSLPPQWSALAARVDDAVTSLDALRAAPGIETALRTIEQVAALYQAIKAINTAPAGVDATAFLADIGEKLFELLLVDYLNASQPTASTLFRATGVISEKSIDEAPGRPAHVETRFHFDELARIASDPGSIPTRLYGWGTSDLNFPLVAEHLAELATAIGLLTRYGDADPVLAAGLQAPVEQTQRSIDSQLTIALAEVDIAGQPTDIGLAILELPPEDTHPAGIIVQPQIPSSLGTMVPITPEWTFTLRAGSDIARTFGILVRPDGVGVRYPFQPGTVPPNVGFGAGLNFTPAQTTILIGKTGATRLQLVGVRTGLGLDLRGSDVELWLEGHLDGLALVIAIGEQDSFLGGLFGGNDLVINAPLGARWSSKRGFTFIGGAGFEVTVAPHLQLGPISIDKVHLGMLASLASGESPKLATVADISFSGALGPIAFVVEGIGVGIDLIFEEGNAGPFDIQVGLRGPTGLGASIDAGPITGGGFLRFDRPAGRYSGILQLRAFEIGITAIGILDTKLPGGAPGFSFLLILTAEFPPLQLGYGFTLNGVGGLAGVNRTMVVGAIQAGIRNHAVDHILFPEDPIRNAPQLLDDLQTIFPPAVGRYVFGPMAIIGWGTPTLIRIELGILIELPAPIRIVLLGQVTVALPTEEAAIIELHIDILGVLDVEGKRISVDAVLHDSRVAAFSLVGDMAFRLSWGESPSFALSVGGLHPRFQPPPGFPSLRRVTVSLGFDDNPRISVQGYFAVTSNSLQFGALAEVYAAAGGFNVTGWLGFDALFVFVPFSFTVDYSAGMSLRRGSNTIAGVRVRGTLSGPKPWHIEGKACISLLFFDVCVGFDATFGEEDHATLPEADPRPLLRAAIEERQNWSAVLPSRVLRVVSLAPPADASLLLLDPVGGAELRERVLPLNRPITKFGEATPIGPNQYDVTLVKVGKRALDSWNTAKDFFARAQFEEMTDAERVSIPSFERMDAGVSVSSDAIAAGPSTTRELTYETLIIDSPWDGRTAPLYRIRLGALVGMVRVGAAARSALHTTGHAKFGAASPSGGAVLADESFVIASTEDLTIRHDLSGPRTKGDAHLALKLHLAAHPADRERLQVLAIHEAAA